MHDSNVTVIGGGLAGCEAALQLADRGWSVRLLEMRPVRSSPAHSTDALAELVCSNSLKGQDVETAAGLLKHELRALDCRLLRIAEQVSVPAGAALAVDREAFAAAVTSEVAGHSKVQLVRTEAVSIPEEGPVIVATGPLTSAGFEQALSGAVGDDRLAFFDAAAPIVHADSLDMRRIFRASRYDKGEGADYLNCPMDESTYKSFVAALVDAERVEKHEFEKGDLFSACMPAEEIALKGEDALRYGPLKPVGLTDPTTGERPHAVVQLRAENRDATAYNLVGFQTNLTFMEQRRVFSMIPGLESADFVRFGVMHRNTYVDAPRVLGPDLSLRTRPNVYLAGQVSGTEGYVEAMASGLLAALNVAAAGSGEEPFVLPKTTALGALIAYATDPETAPYQPMHVNFGLVPPLEQRVRGKRRRYAAYSERARGDLAAYLAVRPRQSPS